MACRVGCIGVVFCWEVVVRLVVVDFVVNLVVGLMVVGTGFVGVVVCWVVVGGAVGCWVGAGLLSVLDRSWKSSWVLTVVEGPGLLVGKVLVGGSGSEISKSTDTFVVRVAVKEVK